MKTEEILKRMKTNEFLLNSNIPMGYNPGIPMLSLRNGDPCLIIPFLKYQMTGEIDKTRVFAPRFVVTVTANDGKIVKYEDLMYDSRFEEVDFRKPVGLFRHSSIRHLKKEDYNKMRKEIYALLDALSDSMTGKMEFDEMDAMKLNKKLSILLEPSMKPFYHAIDKTFFETYIKA